MRKIAIMQPYLFPYIGYFQLINNADAFVIHDDVQYIKGGWVNRNRILMNNAPYLFSFSIKHDSHHLEINRREFSNDILAVKRKFYSQLKSAYKKAPYFDETYTMIFEAIDNDIANISQAITLTIEKVCFYLDIKTEILLSSNLDKNNSLKGQDRVLNICKALNATQYINPIGGQELYSKEVFDAEGIMLNFLKTNPILYKQYDNEFVPNLSIIDVLMFNSKEEAKKMLGEFELI